MYNTCIKLIVGLGNPGDEYKKTRHNLGFEVLDNLILTLKSKFKVTHTCDSFIYSGRCFGDSLHLQKPLTFMNASGQAVKLFCKKKDILPSELLVVYDCLDLPLGRIKLRSHGGSAGHKGLQSIIDEFGTEKFNRLRLGIRPDTSDFDVIDFVLAKFEGEEKKVIDESIKKAVEAIQFLMRCGLTNTMNKYNSMVPLDK